MLDISKILIHQFYCEYMTFKNNAQLIYKNTESTIKNG